MRVVVPETVSPANLTASNIAEDEAPEWYVGTTYNTDDLVIYQNRIYKAQEDGLIGTTPADGVEEVPPTWLDQGATNRYKMFDGKLAQGSAKDDSIALTIQSSRVVDALAFFNLSGVSLTVVVTDLEGAELYNRTVPLTSGETILNLYDYYFNSYGELADVVLVDLPAVQGVTIDITITNTGSIARCGELVIGRQKLIGDTQYGASVSIKDYSRKDTDEFGNPIIVQREYAKVGDFDVILPSGDVSAVQRFLAGIRATPTVFIGGAGYEATYIYGFYKGFELVISGPLYSDCAINVEGLV